MKWEKMERREDSCRSRGENVLNQGWGEEEGTGEAPTEGGIVL